MTPLKLNRPRRRKRRPTRVISPSSHSHSPWIQVRARVKRAIEFGGSIYELIAALSQEFEADLDAGTFKDQYRFAKASVLAKRLRIDEQSLRQRVSRARKKIEQAFLHNCDLQLDDDDVIQNEAWKGYRLNPYLLLVKPAQLRDRPPMSQVGKPGVTPPVPPR